MSTRDSVIDDTVVLDLGAQPLVRSEVTILAGSALAGALVITTSFHLAAAGDPHFLLFWVGYLVALGPVVWSFVTRALPVQQQLALLSLLGLFTMVPKLLRNIGGPLYSDEFAHYRQATQMLATGHVDHDSPLITILPAFPGLHALTAGLSAISGLSIWTVAVGLLLLCHVLTLLGVFALVREVAPRQVAALAAVLYTTCPSWLFFDAQFAYETLAFTLMVWALVFTFKAVRTTGESRVKFLVVALTTAGALVLSHHITAYFFEAVVLGYALVVSARRRDDESRRTVWGVFGGTFAILVAWTAFRIHLLSVYLAPSVPRPIQRLLSAVTGGHFGHWPPHSSLGSVWRRFWHDVGQALSGHEQASHTPFSGARIPWYEIVAGYALPLVLVVMLGVVVWLSWKRRDRDIGALRLVGEPSARWVLAGIALLYYPSVPLLLSVSENEGARRSWAWSWLGLVFVGASLIVWLVQREWPPKRARIAAAGLALALTVVTIGSVAVGQDASYRFPGPYVAGSDTWSQTAEGAALDAWMLKNLGPGHQVLADRYDALTLATIGEQNVPHPSRGYPVWDLYLLNTAPSPKLVRQLRANDVEYMVIDKRMGQQAPKQGIWFTVREPRVSPHQLLFEASLTRYMCLPWTPAVYASTNYQVYRLVLSSTAPITNDPQQTGCAS